MALVSDVYSGDYIVAAQLPAGKRIDALIVSADGEVIGQGVNQNVRIVLSLQSRDGRPWPKKVVLNKTNSLALAAAFGDDSNNWRNRGIEIWQEQVMYQSRLVPGIRLAPVAAPPGNGSAAAPAASPTAPAPAMPSLAAPRPASPASGLGELLDDQIPF